MKKIIEKIAKANGVSVSDVENEMKQAIATAMAWSDTDEERKKLWHELSPQGEAPSIEEFILFMAKKLV